MRRPRPQTRPNDHQRESRRRSTQTPPEAASDHMMSHDNHVIRDKPNLARAFKATLNSSAVVTQSKIWNEKFLLSFSLFYNELPLSYCLTWCTDLLEDYQSLIHTQWLQNKEEKHEERERESSLLSRKSSPALLCKASSHTFTPLACRDRCCRPAATHRSKTGPHPA